MNLLENLKLNFMMLIKLIFNMIFNVTTAWFLFLGKPFFYHNVVPIGLLIEIIANS